MEQLEFKITNIKLISQDEIKISVSIWDRNEVNTILENVTHVDNEMGKSLKTMHYDFTIYPSTHRMTLCSECELQDYFEVYGKYEYSDNLNPTLRRQWKTANIIDNLTSYFFDQGYFNGKIFQRLTIDDIN